MKAALYLAPACLLLPLGAIAQEGGANGNGNGNGNGEARPAAAASFVGADGERNGTAELHGVSGGVLISVEISGLPAESWVAFHVHETGSCDHATGHESAGGHFNPDSSEHGFLAENGPHAGDMPNQYVPADGVLRAQVLNAAVTLDEGEAGIVGRALMIHADPDDYESQPSGDAGDRLACGVIEQSR